MLGDQGNVCVDELDKMRSEDRSALHEALEQQTVSIAKAGIMATLNTRCSVLAAANPKFGKFDTYKALASQIDLPSPILSRFDLTFVLEDKPNVEKDKELAQHILKTHQFSNIAYDIEPELLRKYIAYARKNVHPVLTDGATKVLEEFYVSVRSGAVEEDAPVPITPRQLEATIRLAEASAKLQLKDEVEASDALRAVSLQKWCLEKIGMDPDTGKIDIARVEGRTPTSEKNKMNTVMAEIETLEEEFDNVPVNILKEHLSENFSISEEKTDEILKTLRSKGLIYEPRHGQVKTLKD